MLDSQPENSSKLRLWATITLVACYLVPIILLTLYNTSLLPISQGWGVLTIGLLGAFGGSIILFILLKRWESSLPEPSVSYVMAPPFTEPTFETVREETEQKSLLDEIQHLQELLGVSQKQCETLGEELHHRERSLQALKHEKEQLENQLSQAQQSLKTQEEAFSQQLQGKETLLEEYQLTITDQRAVIEKKQQIIVTLESQAQDLKYELKTLVNLSDTQRDDFIEEPSPAPASPNLKLPEAVSKAIKTKTDKGDAGSSVLDLGLAVPSRSSEEAQQQLKRCIDIAQKLTGARHLAGDSSRFRDLSADGYALDLRRLCDSLRSEQSSMILLYSQREGKALFVNDQVRGLLGWSSDKFLQNFPGLITDSPKEWKSALHKAGTSQRSEATLKIKTRAGEEANVRCLLGSIPTGIFKTHIIGVFYAVE